MMDTLPNQEPAATDDDGRIRIGDTPWTVRLSRGSQGRDALELYAAGHLVDVVVPTALVSTTLRGAGRAPGDGCPFTLAWGVLEAGRGVPPKVTFSRRGLRGTVRREGELFLVGDRFWLDAVEGRFTRVTATRADGGVERRRI
ncbi:hypothetical protein [Streptomyces griseoluteus]|uniref:hypothetical protein n=1 Tax=Streptomyces griseoluteus TaxID=29306 RepID=UPI0036FA0D87